MRNIVNGMLLKGRQVLLAQRSAGRKSYPNLWSFPGGHVEVGESLADALRRELVEEIGVIPVNFAPWCQIDDPSSTSTKVVYHLFKVCDWTGVPDIQDDEHSELRWFDFEEAHALPDLALIEYRGIFNSLRNDG